MSLPYGRLSLRDVRSDYAKFDLLDATADNLTVYNDVKFQNTARTGGPPIVLHSDEHDNSASLDFQFANFGSEATTVNTKHVMSTNGLSINNNAEPEYPLDVTGNCKVRGSLIPDSMFMPSLGADVKYFFATFGADVPAFQFYNITQNIFDPLGFSVTPGQGAKHIISITQHVIYTALPNATNYPTTPDQENGRQVLGSLDNFIQGEKDDSGYTLMVAGINLLDDPVNGIANYPLGTNVGDLLLFSDVYGKPNRAVRTFFIVSKTEVY